MGAKNLIVTPRDFELEPSRPFRSQPVEVRTSPVILNAPITLGIVGGTSVIAARTSGAETDLSNPTDFPLLIDEIKIQAGVLDGVVGASGGVLTQLLALNTVNQEGALFSEAPLRILRVRLSIGRLDLTRDAVPVSGLSETWDLKSDSLCAVYRPRFPIVLMPGKTLNCELAYPTYAYGGGLTMKPNQTVTAQVTYQGRALLDVKPDDFDGGVPFPFLTSYTPQEGPQNVFNTRAFLRSSDSDLMNHTGVALVVDKFVGRVLTQLFDSLNIPRDTLIVNGTAFGPFAAIPERGIKVRMEDSDGVQCVRDGVPFHHLFSAVDCAWWVNALLKPNQFFRAYLDIDTVTEAASASAAGSFPNDSTTFLPMVTMHGWRMIPVGELM